MAIEVYSNNYEAPQRTALVNAAGQTLVIEQNPSRRGWILTNPLSDTIYWSTILGNLGAPVMPGGTVYNDAGELVDTTLPIYVVTETVVGTIGISEHFGPSNGPSESEVK